MDVRYPGVTVDLTDCDGNVFVVLARATGALRASGLGYAADELRRGAVEATSYDEVLGLILSTMHVTI
jgi:hypothetical protein